MSAPAIKLLPGADQHHRPDRRVGVAALDRLDDALGHPRRQRVDRRVVDRDDSRSRRHSQSEPMRLRPCHVLSADPVRPLFVIPAISVNPEPAFLYRPHRRRPVPIVVGLARRAGTQHRRDQKYGNSGDSIFHSAGQCSKSKARAEVQPVWIVPFKQIDFPVAFPLLSCFSRRSAAAADRGPQTKQAARLGIAW